MRALLTLTLNDLRVYFSHRANWLTIGLMPVILILVFGFILSGEGEPDPLRVDVIDRDQSALSAGLIDALRDRNDTLLLCPMDDGPDGRCDLADEPLTLDRAMERVRDGESAALIVIPAGYAAALQDYTGQTMAGLTIDYYSAADPTAPDAVRQTLDAVLQRMNSAALTAAVAGALIDRLNEQTGLDGTAPWRELVVREVYTRTETLMGLRPPAVRYVTTGGEQSDRPGTGFNQAVPGLGSLFVMFTTLGGMAALIRERQRWTLQRLAALPLARSQILGGKVLTYFALGMIQYWIVFVVGLVVGLDFGPRPLLLLLVMGAFVLCCTALAFAIAPFLTREGQANAVTQLLGLVLAALGGAWWPLEIVPEFLQRVGHLSPVAWTMDAFQDLIFYGGGFGAILPELAVLLSAAAVLFGVGVRRFRYM